MHCRSRKSLLFRDLRGPGFSLDVAYLGVARLSVAQKPLVSPGLLVLWSFAAAFGKLRILLVTAHGAFEKLASRTTAHCNIWGFSKSYEACQLQHVELLKSFKSPVKVQIAMFAFLERSRIFAALRRLGML